MQRQHGHPHGGRIGEPNEPMSLGHCRRLRYFTRRDEAGNSAEHSIERNRRIGSDAGVTASDEVTGGSVDHAVRDDLFTLAKHDHVADPTRRAVAKRDADHTAVGQGGAHASTCDRDIHRTIGFRQCFSGAVESSGFVKKELGKCSSGIIGRRERRARTLISHVRPTLPYASRLQSPQRREFRPE